MKIVTFDLDDTIFNTYPLFEYAFNEAGLKFTYDIYTSWDLSEWCDATTLKNLYRLFKDDLLYTMPLLDKDLPNIFNTLMNKSDLKVLFVTERLLKQPHKTFQQLQNAGIKCSFEQVYDKDGKKSDILREIGTNLHFDDSPKVVYECLKKHIPVIMISNQYTLYNHHLRSKVEHYESLKSALIHKGFYTKEKVE